MGTKPDPNSIAPQIIDQAAEWFVTLRDSKGLRDEREAFADWLRTSPVHVRAYLDVVRLWGDAARISRELEAHVETGQRPPNVVPLRERVRAQTPDRRSEEISIAGEHRATARAAPDSKHRAISRRSRFMLAASVVLGFVATGLGVSWQTSRPPVYVTDIGEQRLITLEDGSVVRLNARSEISVRMSPELRRIDLVDGQALFEVVKDPERPFVVHGGPVAIRAVGTQFDVNRRRSGTVVTVVEGEVELSPSGSNRVWGLPDPRATVGRSERQGSERRVDALSSETAVSAADTMPPGSGATAQVTAFMPIALRAGEQVTISRAGAVDRQHEANVVTATSWLQQDLIFNGEPLGAVVEDFNRYVRTPIVIADPALSDLRIDAVFHTTNPDSLLRFVDRIDGVQVEISEKEVRISRTR